MLRIRQHLSYANVMATIAVFGVLGGGAYAASTAKPNSVKSKSVRDNSLKGVDVKDNALTGADILESTLQGATGEKGDKGDTGAPGTARAYGYIDTSCPGGTCSVSRLKGITAVTRPADGTYCVTAPGLDPANVPAVVSVENIATPDPEPLASAEWARTDGSCTPGTYRVVTQWVAPVAVRNSADTGSENVADDEDDINGNDIGFTIIIP